MVVRIDHESLKVLGHALVCGEYAQVTEASARAAANLPADFAYAGGGILLSGSTPPDEWVFVEPGMDSGWTAAVSARIGLPVFAGELSYFGPGFMERPSAWDTTDLGTGCSPPSGVSRRGFNVSINHGALPDAEVTTVSNVALATAIPGAFAQWGALFDIVVLLYPGCGSIHESCKSRWSYIVLLNGGRPDTTSRDGGVRAQID